MKSALQRRNDKITTNYIIKNLFKPLSAALVTTEESESLQPEIQSGKPFKISWPSTCPTPERSPRPSWTTPSSPWARGREIWGKKVFFSLHNCLAYQSPKRLTSLYCWKLTAIIPIYSIDNTKRIVSTCDKVVISDFRGFNLFVTNYLSWALIFCYIQSLVKFSSTARIRTWMTLMKITCEAVQ